MEEKSSQLSTSPSPFLRWAGSKRQHINFLKSFWSDSYQRYVEPFAGSAALFFALSPKKALLADLNEELIEMYETIRDHPTRVHRVLSSMPKGREQYYSIRNWNPVKLTRIQRASRFLYLNRFCFNGLYRTNRQGQFNVPYGAHKAGPIPTLSQLHSCATLLKRTQLISGDFRNTLSLITKGDFVYLDPPYAVAKRRVFTEYGAKIFTVDDLEELEEHLRGIDRRGVYFVLSYADCSEARRVFKNWTTRRIQTRRSVAGFLGARRKQYEICATNCKSAPLL